MSQLNLLILFPFGILLALIALAPLLFAEWWKRHYSKVCLVLSLAVVGYYVFGLRAPHRLIEGCNDYIRFIVLIGSLYIVSGGIHINVKGESTPLTNVLFLLAGALAANFVGTTGASMLLIRPWLRMNRYRVTGHHVVFFIFIVSNVGGCLTPIGDPPLYLGYLRGIPFWWVFRHCWLIWCVGVGVLLGFFYLVDYRNYLRAPKGVRQKLAEPPDRWLFTGGLNLVFLSIILVAAFLEHPLLLRELLMAGAAAGSYLTTRRSVYASNQFTFAPIEEVAILFAAIFATMLPAIDWLQGNAAHREMPSAAFCFFGSGALSSVLDNAPTYLTFLSALLGTALDPQTLSQIQHLVSSHAEGLPGGTGERTEMVRQALSALKLYYPNALSTGSVPIDRIALGYLLGNPGSQKLMVALSVGAVFFGANTYIGNGPNLMVKAIADHQNVRTPSFFGYIIRFTIPYMIPMLMLIWWLFFRA